MKKLLLVLLVLTLVVMPVPVAGCDGVVNVDGTCMTPELYAETFAVSNLLATADYLESLGYQFYADSLRIGISAVEEPNPLLRTGTDPAGPTHGEYLFNLTLPEINEVWERVEPDPTTGVEQWRGLVEQFFPASEVENALAIMACESNGLSTAANPTSSALGLWQHLSAFRDRNAWLIGKTWYDRTDPVLSTMVTALVVEADGGWRQWSCKRVL